MNNTTHAERVIFVTPQHWVRYIRLLWIIGLMSIADVALFVLAGYWAIHSPWLSNSTFMAALLLLLLIHHWAFASLASESARCIIVTNQRVMHYKVRLLVFEELKEIAFVKMKSVDALMHGFIPNLLRYGSLEFEGKEMIKDVPHPNRVAREIEQVQGLL